MPACRKCNKSIEFIQNPVTKRQVPVDVPTVKMVLGENGGHRDHGYKATDFTPISGRVVPASEAETFPADRVADVFVSHFKTCTHPDFFSKNGKHS